MEDLLIFVAKGLYAYFCYGESMVEVFRHEPKSMNHVS
jgi:hypothetical protein